MHLSCKAKFFFILLIVTLIVHVSGTSSHANVSFSNGFWSHSFDCADWTRASNTTPCGGVFGLGLAGSCGGNYTTIESAANNPNGDGGKGFRTWYAAPKNNQSQGVTITWGSYSELWIRWYMKANAGLAGGMNDVFKNLYVTGSGTSFYWGWSGDTFRLTVQENNTGAFNHFSKSGMGFQSVASDNQWHCYEVHYKMDTNNRNGVWEVWVDGVNVDSVSNLDLGSGNPTWTIFPSNHEFFSNSTARALDMDDVAIATSAYTGFTYDSSGRRMIGPIGGGSGGGGSTPPPPPPASVGDPTNLRVVASSGGSGGSGGSSGTPNIIFEENFDNASFSSRGWYDNTGLVLSTSEHIAGSSASAQFQFNQGATTPTSGGAMRKKFTASDEVYLSYYVKYSSNWQGSNRSYHPHEFYFLTNKDDDWSQLARTRLTMYVEQNEGVPLIAMQDGANIDESNINSNLTNTTENRAVAGCNGNSDGYSSSCYSISSTMHNNWKQWTAGGNYYQDSQGSYYKNDWHLVEAYIKMNSVVSGKGQTDGIIQFWYDGQLIIDHNDILIRTGADADMKFDKLIIAPYIGDGSPVTQTFWVDGLKIGTSMN